MKDEIYQKALAQLLELKAHAYLWDLSYSDWRDLLLESWKLSGDKVASVKHKSDIPYLDSQEARTGLGVPLKPISHGLFEDNSLEKLAVDLQTGLIQLQNHWPKLYSYVNPHDASLEGILSNYRKIDDFKGEEQNLGGKSSLDSNLSLETNVPLIEKIFALYSQTRLDQTKPEVYPDAGSVFNAFWLAPEKVKLVIIGQDPYHNGDADGFAFSSENKSASLKNILKALSVNYPEQKSFLASPGFLHLWVAQGVLLLNTRLTVYQGEPLNPDHDLYAGFIDEVFAELNATPQPKVYLLWGKHAQAFKSKIKAEGNLILETSHPSPLSARRGFLDSQQFVEANAFLESKGIEPIIW